MSERRYTLMKDDVIIGVFHPEALMKEYDRRIANDETGLVMLAPGDEPIAAERMRSHLATVKVGR